MTKETKETKPKHIYDLSDTLHRISSFLDLQSYNRVRQCSEHIKHETEQSPYHKHVKTLVEYMDICPSISFSILSKTCLLCNCVNNFSYIGACM